MKFEELLKLPSVEKLRIINERLNLLESMMADKPKRTKFVKPTAQEVEEYGRSIGFKINGNQFINHYESKGWLIGKSPMKSWKHAVNTWKETANPTCNPIVAKKESNEELLARKLSPCHRSKLELSDDGIWRCPSCLASWELPQQMPKIDFKLRSANDVQ